ncbi:BTB/POZ domain-containing protein 6-like [Paramacrobiotus metropolitanus]|uniref:BTB/POZ domain-containing protein 6-like n=1 Tax=Paramacrobiotus metropolitanus TaxID=2943436 RepID=UPI0024458B8E|nr:BTB/POZ domain-containing protein 6-like [Paramacrobiotus metropolitanus]
MSQSSTLSSISWSDRRGGVEKIADCMKEMLARGESSDVQFAIGRSYGAAQVFPAHKLIMSARSNVFHQMFYGALPEKCTAPIDIPDILPDAFANMLSC